MDEDAAQERLRRMFALQKGTEFRFPFFTKLRTFIIFVDNYLVRPFLRMVKGFLVTTYKIPYKNGMKCSVISRLHQSKEWLKTKWFSLCHRATLATLLLFNMSNWENGILRNIQFTKLADLFYLWRRFYYSGFLNFSCRTSHAKFLSYPYFRKPCVLPFFSDPIQINGVKLLEDFSEVSMQHLMALDRRTINLWGESSGKTIPIRMKRDCIYNVSSSSIYGLNSIRSRDASDQANRVKVIPWSVIGAVSVSITGSSGPELFVVVI